jgi:CheY-like chemotaxis protein
VPHTLLLADDSVTIQRVIELTFADEDVQVVAVSDGDQAIAHIEASPPDIVLADIGMPGKNGYEVARYIKQSPHLAHIPVVLLTGAFEPVDQQRAAEAGCDGVLAKPFEPQLVIGRVKDLLAHPRRVPPSLDVHLASPQAAARPIDLGDYFDRLDAAFASLSNTPPAAPGQNGDAPSAVAEGIDWFSASGGAGSAAGEPWDLPASPKPSDTEASDETADLPLSYVPPPPAQTAPPSGLPPVPAPASRRTPLPPLPPLADAFAALLAAEAHERPPSAAPSWPTTARSAPAITDDLIEEVVRRVLVRLQDRLVRETVADLVPAIAERLIREEIDRIKASIK